MKNDKPAKPDAEKLLPCDVWLAPATRIAKGCPYSTLEAALSVEGRPDGDDFRLTRTRPLPTSLQPQEQPEQDQGPTVGEVKAVLREKLDLSDELLADMEDNLTAVAVAVMLKCSPTSITDTDGVEAWRPIETAPKDGSYIDLWAHGMRQTDCCWGLPQHCCGEAGRYCDDEWHGMDNGWVDSTFNVMVENPTHWMPLPEAPRSPTQDTTEGDVR
jgi:hypothetical protein